MKLKGLDDENMSNYLFEKMNKFKMQRNFSVNLSSVNSGFELSLEVMDQNKISSVTPKFQVIVSINKLKNNKLFPSDIFINTFLKKKNPNKIHNLIGSNYAGIFFTGKIKKKIIKWFNRKNVSIG